MNDRSGTAPLVTIIGGLIGIIVLVVMVSLATTLHEPLTSREGDGVPPRPFHVAA